MPLSDVGPKWHSAHGLDTAGDADLDGTDPDEVVHEVVGLLGRAALAVHRRGCDLVREALEEPGHPGDVEALLARLGHAPADDLFDDGRVDTGPLDHFDLGGTEQFGGREPDSHPLRLPIGVRTASTITGLDIPAPLVVCFIAGRLLVRLRLGAVHPMHVAPSAVHQNVRRVRLGFW